MNHVITLIEKMLTDGSMTYDVRIGNAVFSCVTLEDAEDFMTRFEQAVTACTNEGTVRRVDAP